MTAATSRSVTASREAILADVRAMYDARYLEKEGGVYSDHDWRRCQAAFDLVTGSAVLEVGVGPGQMFNALARDPNIGGLVGLDISWNLKLLRPERGTLELGDAMHLRFDARSFDTVLCMEVLEHMEPIDFPKALHELRRVCRGTLIMTVPYEEPEPLWHYDRKGGHRQQFTEEKIERWFPRAERHMISRGRGKWAWIMLVERADEGATARRLR